MKEKALKELKKKQRLNYLITFLEVSVLVVIVILLYCVFKTGYVWIAAVAIAAFFILENLKTISILNQAKKDIIADKYKVVRDKDGKVKVLVDRLGFEVNEDD